MKTTGLFLLLLLTHAEGTTSRLLQAEGDIKSLESAIAMFRLNARMLPDPQEGLCSLVERPARLAPDARWIQILSKLPVDPWGNPYAYLVGDGFREGFGIYSRGGDGQSATQGNDADDISSWHGRPSDPPLGWKPFVPLSLFACAMATFLGFEWGRYSARNSPSLEPPIAPGDRPAG